MTGCDETTNATRLLTRAFLFAAERHAHQLRKGEAGEPYINHPAEVADLVAGGNRRVRSKPGSGGPAARRGRGHGYHPRRHCRGVRRRCGGTGRGGYRRQDAAQGGAQAPAGRACRRAQSAGEGTEARRQDEQSARLGCEPTGRLVEQATARLYGLGPVGRRGVARGEPMAGERYSTRRRRRPRRPRSKRTGRCRICVRVYPIPHNI